jgi:phosphoenolpyruvate carboxykinase (GTP)
MVPYCAYDVGIYLDKWVSLRKTLGYSSPKVFFVNWFRKDQKGEMLWPGFGENSRILKWICERTEINAPLANRTAFGYGTFYM